MKDEDYARELLAILKDPKAAGIDREHGFGRDIRVTAVDIVRGEHGPELEVTFVRDTQRSVRVPFGRDWRRLSGYDTPAAYAPRVAHEVFFAAPEGTSPARPLPDREAQWQLLLDALAPHGPVREVGPGRIEVAEVTVVVSPQAWERVLAKLDDVDLYVAEILGPRDDDERFLVAYKDDLVRSTREELPPVRGRAHERESTEGLYWTGPAGDRLG